MVAGGGNGRAKDTQAPVPEMVSARDQRGIESIAHALARRVFFGADSGAIGVFGDNDVLGPADKERIRYRHHARGVRYLPGERLDEGQSCRVQHRHGQPAQIRQQLTGVVLEGRSRQRPGGCGNVDLRVKYRVSPNPLCVKDGAHHDTNTGALKAFDAWAVVPSLSETTSQPMFPVESAVPVTVTWNTPEAFVVAPAPLAVGAIIKSGLAWSKNAHFSPVKFALGVPVPSTNVRLTVRVVAAVVVTVAEAAVERFPAASNARTRT
jgi:hypothetical protein